MIPKQFLFPLLILFAVSSVAQQARPDILLKANARYTREDTKKLQLLNQLTFVYINMQYDSAGIYANKTIALAQKLNNQKELAAAYNTKSAFFMNEGKYAEAATLLQKAIDINIKINEQSGLAFTYANISFAYILTGNDSLSYINIERSYDLYLKLKEVSKVALANLGFSEYYWNKDFKKAKLYALASVKGYEDAHNMILKRAV